MTPDQPDPRTWQTHPSHVPAPPQPAPYGQAPYPQQPGYGHPPQPIYVHAPVPHSGVATASLVFGILGVLGGWCTFGIPCVLAVVFGHVGMAETANGRKGGRGSAVAGLILGYLLVIPMFIAAMALIGGQVSGDSPTPASTGY